MTAILPVLMLLLIFAIVATCFNEGIWSNVVRLINVITAGLVAMTFFEPLARRSTAGCRRIRTCGIFFHFGRCSPSPCWSFARSPTGSRASRFVF